MNRWTRGLTVALWLTALAPMASAAQTSVSGLGVRYAVPYDAMEDVLEPGYGVVWNSLGDMGNMWVSLSSGWTRFKRIPVEGIETEDENLSQAEFLFGMGLKLGTLWVGAKAGYFFKDEDEWDVVPTATLRLGNMVVSGEAKVRGDVRWYGVQVGWVAN